MDLSNPHLKIFNKTYKGLNEILKQTVFFTVGHSFMDCFYVACWINAVLLE